MATMTEQEFEEYLLAQYTSGLDTENSAQEAQAIRDALAANLLSIQGLTNLQQQRTVL